MPEVLQINENRVRAFPVNDLCWDPPNGVVNERGVLQGSQLWPMTLLKEWNIRIGTWNVGTLT